VSHRRNGAGCLLTLSHKLNQQLFRTSRPRGARLAVCGGLAVSIDIQVRSCCSIGRVFDRPPSTEPGTVGRARKPASIAASCADISLFEVEQNYQTTCPIREGTLTLQWVTSSIAGAPTIAGGRIAAVEGLLRCQFEDVCTWNDPDKWLRAWTSGAGTIVDVAICPRTTC
jgi:hypothetical protein